MAETPTKLETTIKAAVGVRTEGSSVWQVVGIVEVPVVFEFTYGEPIEEAGQ